MKLKASTGWLTNDKLNIKILLREDLKFRKIIYSNLQIDSY